jgi:hypothetical protein
MAWSAEMLKMQSESKDLTQRTQRKGGERSEKDRGVYPSDEEKGNGAQPGV